jgi:hypothetical protein
VQSLSGICELQRGNLGKGLQLIEDAILGEDNRGYRTGADWFRLNLAEVYLEIIAGNKKLPFVILLKNLPVLLTVIFTAESRVRTLTAQALENPHFDPGGFHVGRARMLLGLLDKRKKRHVTALGHLSEAKRILSQFGQTPILSRVETALAELRQ